MFREILKPLASLKLALILLAVIIIASIAGTWYESKVSAEVAKRLIYGNIWFDIWLTFLAINLFSVAAIRYPWKPHQTGFVITHAGIIVLLIGSMIDRHFGVEGFVQLHRGVEATDVMELREQELVATVDGVQEAAHTQFNVKSMDKAFKVKSPDPAVKIEVIDTKEVEVYKDVSDAQTGPAAVHLHMEGPMMGQQDRWLFLGDNFEEGPAVLAFQPGMPPPANPAGTGTQILRPRQERYYVFTKNATEPMISERVGEPTRAVVNLVIDPKTAVPTLKMQLLGKSFDIPVKGNEKTDYPLMGLDEWKVYIYGYFPNFRMEGGKPVNFNDNPDNPAIFFDLLGPKVMADVEKPLAKHGGGNMAPGTGMGGEKTNALQVYLGDDGKLRYFLKSRKDGDFAGEVVLSDKKELHWAPGATFTIDEYHAHSSTKMAWRPLENVSKDNENQAPGLFCRITVGNDKKEVWLGQRMLKPHTDDHTGKTTVELPREIFEVGGKKVGLSFANQFQMLPFKVSLLKFSAPANEGMENEMSFASFESTLSFDGHLDWVLLKPDAKILAEARNPQTKSDIPDILEGGKSRDMYGAIIAEDETQITMEFLNRQTVTVPKTDIAASVQKTRKIYMNSPTTYPEVWYGPWLGTTYKFSQAEHRMPVDPDYSGVQILRDPGWMPKWVGCLMICFGIFTMFYLKPYFNRRPEPVANAGGKQKKGSEKDKGKLRVADSVKS